MYSCVKVITPGAGTAPFTETISGINDAQTGTPFAVRTMLLIGGNTAAVNTLSYWGMTSSNSAGDSGYHWDLGVMHDANGGAEGGGICHDFNLKVGSGADGYGYPFFDTWPDIFFGGYIGGFGYVNNVLAGSFDITWARRDRYGDSKLILCLGGSDYSAQQQTGVANGVIATSDVPQGVLQFSCVNGTLGSGPAPTGAGGTGWIYGWEDRDGNRAALLTESVSQGGNDRTFWTDRFNNAGAHVTAWTPSSITVAGASGGGGVMTTFMGANVVVKSGRFSVPATDSSYSFNLGLNAKGIIFQTVGLPLAQAGTTDTTQTQACIGFVDPARSSGSYWTGDTTVGNSVPILGARYISNTEFTRTADTINANSTTFKNIGTVSYLDTTGAITVAFTSTDGTQPSIAWWAIGVEADQLGTVEVDKVWTAADPGQVTLRIGTTIGGSEIASQLTGAAGGAPLVLGPETVNAGTYYVSETHTNIWDVSLSLTVNGVSTPIGPDGQITVANGDVIVVTITNADIPPPSRPKQWRLYKFNMKLRKEERA